MAALEAELNPDSSQNGVDVPEIPVGDPENVTLDDAEGEEDQDAEELRD